MKLKDFKLVLIFVFCINSIFAQEIVCKIVDIDTQKPLSLVYVLENDEDYVGFSDILGEVDFTMLGKTKRILTFQTLGYHKIEREFLLTDVDKTILVELTPLTEELSEVVLSTKKEKLYSLTTLKEVEGTHIYAGKKSEVVNLDLVTGSKSTNNPRQIFANVAGINVYDSNDGGLQLNIGGRGLDPNRTSNFNTRQNDYDISADVLGYPESYYTPPTEALSQIQVIRGAASLQYGTQFGGLVNFIFHKPSSKQIEFINRTTLASFGTLTNFASLSGTVGKFSYYTFYNKKKGDGFRPNSGYSSDNAFIHLGYRFNKDTNVSFEYTYFDYLAQQSGGLSDVQFLEDPYQSYRERNWFAVNWNLFNFKLEHEFSKKTSGTLSLFGLSASRKAVGFRGNYIEIDPDLFDSSSSSGDQQDAITGEYEFNRDVLKGDFKNYGAEARIITEYEIGEQSSFLLLGTKFYQANNTSQQGPGTNGTDADFTFITQDFENTKSNELYPENNFEYPNLNVSVFGENIFKLTDKLSVTPGFRYEYIKTQSEGEYLDRTGTNGIFVEDNNNLERHFVLLGAGLSYKPTTFMESYFNVSQNYRSVTFSDIRTINPSFVIDPNIEDETGYTIDIGVRGSLENYLSYDVNVYTLQYNNRIGQRFSTEPPYRAQWVRDNIGGASIVGLESLIQWNIKETFFEENDKIKLNAFTNLALTTSEYTSSDEDKIEGNEVEFVPNVNLKTGFSFGYKNFLSSLQYTYMSDQFTDATNSPYDATNADNVDGAIPSYDILDFSTSYKFNKYLKLEGGINNLLDNTYFTRRATGYPGPGIIPAEPRYYYLTLEFKI